MTLPDKAAVREALRSALAAALEAMANAARETREGAVHEENRSEGSKDMRSTEQSYLARGQAMRAEDLAEELTRLDRTPLRSFAEDDAIQPGALVRVLVDDAPRVLFVTAQGGGTELEVEGVRVTVVTPASPFGRALVGRRLGDDFESRAPGRHARVRGRRARLSAGGDRLAFTPRAAPGAGSGWPARRSGA